MRAQQVIFSLAKRIDQDDKDHIHYTSREREGIVQASSLLVAQLLGGGAQASSTGSQAAAPVQQFSSLQLGLMTWSLSKLVGVDSRVRSSQTRQLVDAIAGHAGNSSVMDRPADEACRHWSRLVYSISKSGIMCSDSQAVRQVFDVAARQMPEMLQQRRPCVPQNVANPLLAYAYAEYPGSLNCYVAEIAHSLDWVMRDAKPQVSRDYSLCLQC
jgi:hypothetical protein